MYSVPVKDLTRTQRVQAARLVIVSLPEYYALFEAGEDALLAAVADQLYVVGSELSGGNALLDDDVAGIYCTLPSQKLRAAQFVGLRHLTSALKPAQSMIREGMTAYGQSVAPLQQRGHYLTRIAVRDELKGTGVAETLLRCFLDECLPGEPALLHVNHVNSRAIRFYEKNGFKMIPDAGFQYHVMMCHPKAQTDA